MWFKRKPAAVAAACVEESGSRPRPESTVKCETGTEEYESYRGETYYGIPPVKHSHYRWPTSLAFFFNSLGGGVQLLSALIDYFGDRKNRRLVRTGRYIAAGSAASSAFFLISELHTRSRWYNMLRLFKRTSPMSIGIWSITPFGILSGLSAIGEAADSRGMQRGHGIGQTIGVPAALLGSVVMTYMGTEQEETNTPLWASAHPLMSPFYAAMGMSNATAALSLAAEATGAGDSIKFRLNTLALVSGSAELVLGTMIDRCWSKLPGTRFYGDSLYSPLFRHGYMKAGVIYPLVLNTLYLLPYGRSPARTVPAALAKMAGVLLVQFIMIYAGRASGDHAEEYFEYTQPRSDPTGTEESVVPTRRASSLLPLIASGVGVLVTGAFVFRRARR